MQCVFCDIVNGNLPAYKIFESENFLAFLDINPRTKGHCLVIPKQHYQSLLEIPEDKIFGLFNVTKFIANRIVSKLNAKAFNICINNGKDAGQVIPHLHVHIIPRYGEDRELAIESILPVKEELKSKLGEIANILKV